MKDDKCTAKNSYMPKLLFHIKILSILKYLHYRHISKLQRTKVTWSTKVQMIWDFILMLILICIIHKNI